MVVILRSVVRPMLTFRAESPVSLTIPPRFGRAPDLFSGDGYILVLQPIGRQWADNELRMGRELAEYCTHSGTVRGNKGLYACQAWYKCVNDTRPRRYGIVL